MNFLHGFRDELVKTAGPGLGRMLEGLKSMAPKAESMKGLAKGVALGGGGLAAGAAIGNRHGKKEGFAEGTREEGEIADQARQLGRQEGVLAYHQMLQQRLQEEGAQ